MLALLLSVVVVVVVAVTVIIITVVVVVVNDDDCGDYDYHDILGRSISLVYLIDDACSVLGKLHFSLLSPTNRPLVSACLHPLVAFC